MDYLEKLDTILNTIEDLFENKSFMDLLDGEEEGFLNTCWDFFSRVEDRLAPGESRGEDDPILWRVQQDEETD